MIEQGKGIRKETEDARKKNREELLGDIENTVDATKSLKEQIDNQMQEIAE